MMKSLLLIFTFMALSCGSAHQSSRNADLVVTYQNKVVYRASSYYKDYSEAYELSKKKTIKYFIFSNESCDSCKFLRRTLKQSGHLTKVCPLNVDEPWVQYMANLLDIEGIPSLVVVDENDTVKEIIVGPSKIVMYLLINVET